jgi:DNA primase/DNA-binding MarR family transcriptional regulator
MEIPEIKRQLPIGRVLEHYGLKPDRNDRLHCPFHPDRTPSLQIYPKTDTYCCFSSNCTAGTGDVIEFIGRMEKCTKHEALVKAAALCGGGSSSLPSTTAIPAARLFIETGDELEKQAVLGKVFSSCKRALPLTKKALEYLQGRGIDYTQHETGYNSGGLHGDSKNHHLVAGMEKYGLLKRRPAGGYSVWARDCIIFPLRNQEHQIVSLYGRSITNDTDQRHFYLSSREGLYPGYPKPEAPRLILTESIIDAVSITQQHELSIQYDVLALYGTNGLTDEHLQAILALRHLEEIIFMLNGDDAGRAATAKHATALHALLPDITLTTVAVPEGEDVNSLLQTHDDPRVLAAFIGQRTAFSFSIEPAATVTEQPKSPAPAAVSPAAARLITANPELLVYDSGELLITVLGGIKLTGLDRMKVTLKVEHKALPRLPVRHHLDLYNHPHTEQLINKIADSLDIPTQQATQTIAMLTSELESYRARRMESLQPRAEERVQLSPAERQAAIGYLKQANLLERTGEDIGRSGIVGEEINRLITWLVYSSRKLPVPLHLLFLGSSGTGKTWLQERVSELIPPEDKIEITQITENAFYYFRQDELRHRLLLIEDLDGAEASLYPLRELQSKRRISKTVTLKDSKGNLKTITLTVEGPVSVSGCTTREKVYEDNANRCLLLYIDGSKEQDRRILDYQRGAAAGEIDRESEQFVRRQLQHVQRVLVPVTVVNPYAKYIDLPQQVFKPRRTMTLLLACIEAVTFYHQYQRPVKRDGQGHPYIESTAGDIGAAFSLLKDVLFHKSDELTQASRSFLERLKVLLKEQSRTSFHSRDIRRQLRLAPSTLKRYLVELERYGYLKVSRPGRRSRYEYSVADPAEYDALRSAIDQQLQQVLDQIKSKR